MKKIILISVILGFSIAGCDNLTDTSSSSSNTNSEGWSIDRSNVYDGGPGKDGIPAISNPKFSPASAIEYLDFDDLVVGIKIGDEIKAYPHPVLDWHEIVNDEVNGEKIALTYCPLTGSALGWGRVINGNTTTFGVSGLLYNNNLIPYDRGTNSNWSQMEIECVNGPLRGESPQLYSVVETTWKNWKEAYPDSKVLTTSTGYKKPYGNYPYGDYRSSEKLLFPLTHQDDRLHRKARVLGVNINGVKKAYPIGEFPGTVAVREDNLNGIDIIIVGSSSRKFAVAFEAHLNGNSDIEFKSEREDWEIILKDDLGNKYNIFGEVVSGPNKGESLNRVRSYIAYWFAWAAFNPDTQLNTK